ncbi:MAG: uncharacterized protein JWN34_1995 [Bryobacterales bacterium]|nr:uncharacterized protein [Bryobacterales bacterium]
MKILKLTAENVKKLKVVELSPTGGLNQITGKNGSGKTSVLDAIWWALGGKEGIQDKPVRVGQAKACIRLDLGPYVVQRTFTAAGGTALTVENAEGARYPSPQAMLDELLGELSFDPLAFSRMAPKAQFDELRRISKLAVDIDALNAQNAGDFKARTDLNRDLRAKRAQAESLVVPADTPSETIDENALVDEIQAAGEHNADIENRKARREQAAREVIEREAEASRMETSANQHRERTAKRVKELQDQIAALQAESAESIKSYYEATMVARDRAAEIQKKLDSAGELPAPIDVATLRRSLDAAKTVNANVRMLKQKAIVTAEAEALEANAKKLTDAMAEREREKATAISSAEMPIDGLSFGEGTVLYNGIPFNQASGAEQLRVSCSIAMAGNPKLRVIRIQDGSLLDEDGIQLIADMAADKDYQVWLERVDSSGKIGIVMEDGEVASVNEAAA